MTVASQVFISKQNNIKHTHSTDQGKKYIDSAYTLLVTANSLSKQELTHFLIY